MRIYAVSDVHGNYTLLRKKLEERGFFNEKKPHKLLVNGDLLDRGPEANQLIDFMVDLMEKDSDRCFSVSKRANQLHRPR